MFKKIGLFVAIMFATAQAMALDVTAVITDLTAANTDVGSILAAILVIITGLLVFRMVRKAMGS